MPAPTILHDVSHRQQLHDGDCLAACVAMILDTLDHPVEYAALLRLLRIRAYGAPASNVRLLSALGFDVIYSMTDLSGLAALLRQGHPAILFVRTGELPYWSYSTDHALLCVGYDEHYFYVHDPHLEAGPTQVQRGDLELAWLEHDFRYAVVTRSSTDATKA